jgi:Cu/Ag efflux protein CusF
MRLLTGFLAALLLSCSAALAAEAEGHIKAFDRDAQTITLQDGKTYKLPGEFDLDSIKVGMDVVLAYDRIEGQNLITDIQLPE